MSHQHLPSLPARVTASELLHGDDEGFIINAYAALQAQWPDDGGFQHYRHLLNVNPGARAQVLRELSRSQVARNVGADFIDDLRADHVYDPAAGDAWQHLTAYHHTSLRLRLALAARDAHHTREQMASVQLQPIVAAVQSVVDTCLANLAQLDSRISSLQDELAALRVAQAGTPPPATEAPPAADTELSWLRHEVLRLNARLQAVEQGAGTSAAVQRLEQELAQLQAVVGPLHSYTTGELKRQVADYVNALAQAQANAAQVDAPDAASETPRG